MKFSLSITCVLTAVIACLAAAGLCAETATPAANAAAADKNSQGATGGHDVARAAPAQARALLERAVDALQNDRAAALKLFNDRPGPFFEDDLYVFVIDLNDKRFLANGADPSLVGKDAMLVVDVTPNSFGRPLLERMLAAVADRDRAEVDYAWSNPVTNLGEHKHAYLRKVTQMLVGVGYYTPSVVSQR